MIILCDVYVGQHRLANIEIFQTDKRLIKKIIGFIMGD